MSTLAIAVALLVPAACSVIIGADKDRRVSADAGNGTTAPPDASVVPPLPTGPGACKPNEKRCGGTCVAADDPAYGCSATECLPRCSLPFTSIVRCDGAKCAVAQCKPDRGDCNQNDEDGCEADLGRAESCGACNQRCNAGAAFCELKRGGCVTACSSAATVCGKKCTDLANDFENCGVCQAVCPGEVNADPVCQQKTCLTTCREGFANCDQATPACESKRAYYVDNDRDGYGAGAKVGESCGVAGAEYSLTGSDCSDDNAIVNPAQKAYFGVGYLTPAGISFDYDCNGVEEGEPTKPPAPCSPTFRCH